VAQRVFSASREGRGLLLGRQTHFGPSDLLTRAHARLRHSNLDASLASGADPCDSRALACRAAWLTRSRTREKLAASVDDVLAPVLTLSSAVAPDRREVSVASAHLMRLRALLRSRAPVYAQGMAMLRQVLRDGGSPMYLPAWPGALAQAIEEIIAALEGSLFLKDSRSERTTRHTP
jgi:hypothetical protein